MKTKNTRVLWASNECVTVRTGDSGLVKRTGMGGAGNDCYTAGERGGVKRKGSIVCEMGLRAYVKVRMWKYIHRLCQALSDECVPKGF
jgi:hypothetical protein